MKQKHKNQDKKQNFVAKQSMGNDLKSGRKQIATAIKTENGSDINIPFERGESSMKRNEDSNLSLLNYSHSKSPQKSSTSFQNYGKKGIQPYFKKEVTTPVKYLEMSSSSSVDSSTAKAICLSPKTGLVNNTLIKRLQSDLTPQAILPVSSGKRVHTSVISFVSDAKKIKLSKSNEISKHCRSYSNLSLKQEPLSIDAPYDALESNKLPLALYQPNKMQSCNSNLLVPVSSVNKQLKNFKQEDAFRHMGTKKINASSKCSMSNYLLNLSATSPQKTLSVSSTFISNMSTSFCRDSSTKTFISSTVMSSSSTKGRGRREIEQLYKSLNEISWAQDKDFTSLLYAKNSVRHSDRNSGIKAAITDRSKKLAKLGKSPQKSIAALSKQQKSPKAIKQPLTIKPKQNTSPIISMQKRVPKNANVNSSKQQQQIKMSLQKKNATLSKKHNISKKITQDPNQPLSFDMEKSIPKKSKVSKKEKIKSISPPQLEKKTITSKQLSTNKKEKIKEKVQHLKLSSALKKKIPIQSVKPIIDHMKKLPLETHSKVNASKPAWQSLCKPNEVKEIILEDQNLISAFSGPELRVTVKPLEKSQPWVSDCNFQSKLQREYDAHNRRTFQEKVRKAYASIDQTHVNSVLQEIRDSIGIFPNKTKFVEEKTKKSVRSSVRQSECAFRYKEIVVKKHDNYLQVVLVPNIQKQNSLTIEAIKELKEAFVAAKKDVNCNAVLLSSSGGFFCSGIDLGQLYGSNKKHIAEEMASSLKDLIMTLAVFPKPVVAAVNGSAIGLGVSLLMYCDIILASDKATFCIPATKMGYVPEGGVTLTLPQVVGSSCAIEMLLHGRRLTAQQALKFGMVSEVLWPTQLMEEVIPRVRSLAEQSLQVMEITKTMVRCHLWEKLPAQLENEERLLPSQWLSSECQQNIKKHLQTGWLFEY